MTYTVHEIYPTIQGEGANVGRTAVFLRFAGCNLWTGREADRARAVCRFCDTEFVGTGGPGGGRFATANALADAVETCWVRGTCASGAMCASSSADAGARHDGVRARFVVCTGGEPLLQLDAPLVDALHARGFRVAVETNGTQPAPPGIDWTCVSPKAGTELVLTAGDELKLVYPQEGMDPAALEPLEFTHYFLQPMDGPDVARNTELAIHYCMTHPRWRLSVQTHKLLGIS